MHKTAIVIHCKVHQIVVSGSIVSRLADDYPRMKLFPAFQRCTQKRLGSLTYPKHVVHREGNLEAGMIRGFHGDGV